MKNLTNNPRVTNVECEKEQPHGGINLSYCIDGIPYNVTGEFYIDKHGILHHEAIHNGEEIEIMVQYFEN